ncbi:hypothetical protein AAMO2058_000234000 [Amorphochlora amoebiformis]
MQKLGSGDTELIGRNKLNPFETRPRYTGFSRFFPVANLRPRRRRSRWGSLRWGYYEPSRCKTPSTQPSLRERARMGLRELDLNIIGADVVGVSPPFDSSDLTSIAGANILFEILRVMIASRASRK